MFMNPCSIEEETHERCDCIAVWKLGQSFLYDAYIARSAHGTEDFDSQLFTLDDVDQAFALHRFVRLKYSQQYQLPGQKGAGIVVTPVRRLLWLTLNLWFQLFAASRRRFDRPELTRKCAQYEAGHMLGGAVWKITTATEELIYAVDYHVGNERILTGTVLDEISESRPTLLITDAVNAQYLQSVKRSARSVRRCTAAACGRAHS